MIAGDLALPNDQGTQKITWLMILWWISELRFLERIFLMKILIWDYGTPKKGFITLIKILPVMCLSERWQPWSIVAQFLLIDGICSSYPNIFPNTLSECCFYVEKSQDHFGFYSIDDEDLEITTLIAEEMLENPTFDLVGWYRNELDEGDLYNKVYTNTTLQLQGTEQSDSSYLEQSKFSDAESILSVLLDMFDQDSDQNSDLDQLPDLQPVSDKDLDLESQATLESGSHSIFAPSIANLEPNSTDLDTESTPLESTTIFDLESKSDSGSSLGDLTGYERRKVGDILAWKVQEVLTYC